MGGSTGFQYFRPPLSIGSPNAEARDIRLIANLIEGSDAAVAYVGCVGCVVAHNTILDPHNWILRILQETTSTPDYEFEACRDGVFVNNLVYFERGDLSTYVNIGPNTASETFTFANNLWYAWDNPAQSEPTLPVVETDGIYGLDPGLGAEFRIGPASPAAAPARTPPGPGVISAVLAMRARPASGRSRLDSPPGIGASRFLGGLAQQVPADSVAQRPRGHYRLPAVRSALLATRRLYVKRVNSTTGTAIAATAGGPTNTPATAPTMPRIRRPKTTGNTVITRTPLLSIGLRSAQIKRTVQPIINGAPNACASRNSMVTSDPVTPSAVCSAPGNSISKKANASTMAPTNSSPSANEVLCPSDCFLSAISVSRFGTTPASEVPADSRCKIGLHQRRRFRMASRRFLITGGSQGIGAAIVQAAREAGNEVVFTGRNEELIEQVAAETGAHGLRADVSAAEDNDRTVKACQEHMGGVDVLVNNAGYGYMAPIGEVDMGAMKTMFDTNVFGLVDLTNRVVPLMKAQGEGDIINIASTSGIKGHANGTAYSASKWAVRGISQCWQAELRPHDIRVVCVCPSEVQTAWGGKTGRNNPHKLYASDIADAILSTLSANRRASGQSSRSSRRIPGKRVSGLS